MSNSLLFFPGARAAPATAPSSAAALQPEAARLARALRMGENPPDDRFDQFLDAATRSHSKRHWTPLAVAARAAEWLDECNVSTVLDIGSGAGKFCVAAALASQCHYTGLEHRGGLVACARSLARAFGVESRTHFIHGALGQVRLPAVDAYYLYNPFEENVRSPYERIDDSVELGAARAAADLEAMHVLLSRAPAGTYVLTYNGIGASLPQSYSRVRIDRELPNMLVLWRKSASRFIGRARHAPGAGAA